ncbi:PREDICTED: bifunctional coenzyme A synthase-like, partial [Amphimedon queenslandica]|uniref:Dephospho-CoA kinase n=1 Tax=Amphimedon queenslandica TaxID=400682 RepID=A0AAN0J745_AMPQE
CGLYLIGLTGGTASGKSSIAKRLSGLGAYVIDCDKLGHKTWEKCLQKSFQEFEKDVLLKENGEINRRALGSIVFSDKTKLERLNEIVLPEIWRLAMKEVDTAGKEDMEHNVHGLILIVIKDTWCVFLMLLYCLELNETLD